MGPDSVQRRDTGMDGYEKLDRLEIARLAGRISRRTFVVGAMATGIIAATAAQALASELDDIRDVQTRNVASLKKSYDYVVVGAGSAGCALVGKLAKKQSAQILLIEAGDWDTAPSVQDPPVVHQRWHRAGLGRCVDCQCWHQQSCDP